MLPEADIKIVGGVHFLVCQKSLQLSHVALVQGEFHCPGRCSRGGRSTSCPQTMQSTLVLVFVQVCTFSTCVRGVGKGTVVLDDCKARVYNRVSPRQGARLTETRARARSAAIRQRVETLGHGFKAQEHTCSGIVCEKVLQQQSPWSTSPQSASPDACGV